MKTVEDYKNRDAHIIKYIEQQVSKADKVIEQGSYMSVEAKGRRSAYKDILYKLKRIENQENKKKL
jgi:hypothetical protein